MTLFCHASTNATKVQLRMMHDGGGPYAKDRLMQ